MLVRPNDARGIQWCSRNPNGARGIPIARTPALPSRRRFRQGKPDTRPEICSEIGSGPFHPRKPSHFGYRANKLAKRGRFARPTRVKSAKKDRFAWTPPLRFPANRPLLAFSLPLQVKNTPFAQSPSQNRAARAIPKPEESRSRNPQARIASFAPPNQNRAARAPSGQERSFCPLIRKAPLGRHARRTRLINPGSGTRRAARASAYSNSRSFSTSTSTSACEQISGGKKRNV